MRGVEVMNEWKHVMKFWGDVLETTYGWRLRVGRRAWLDISLYEITTPNIGGYQHEAIFVTVPSEELTVTVHRCST
jgi:hypothetical protein